jgi:hypothetical protein
LKWPDLPHPLKERPGVFRQVDRLYPGSTILCRQALVPIKSNNFGIMSSKVTMVVQINVPEEIAGQFTAEPGGIARAAVEAFAAVGLRFGKLTPYQARQLLGIRSRYEMDGFLKARGLFLPATIEEIVADSQTAIAFSR